MITKRGIVVLSLLCALFLLINSAAAAQAPANLTVNYVDTTNFPEVRMYVSVTDAQKNPVLSLDRGNFTLIEGGTSVPVDSLSNQLDQMFVVMMLDTTGSMMDPDPAGNVPMTILKRAAVAFVSQMDPQDLVSVYSFNEKPGLRCNFTTDRKQVTDCINGINAESKWTALWDSASAAVDKVAEIPRGRRAVVLFTDGTDNYSKLKSDDVVKKASDLGIPIYTIAAGADINAKDLARVSQLTNGQSLTSNLSADIPKLFTTLSGQLKNQYKLVYTSIAPEGRADLNIKVNVKGSVQQTSLVYPVPAVQTTIPLVVPLVDASQFPDVKSYVSVPQLPAGVPITPTVANFFLQEDGSRVTPTKFDLERRGALIQFVLDTSVDLTQKGATQQQIWTEESQALLALTDTDKWLDKKGSADLVSVVASQNDPDHPNVTFTKDYQLLHNFAYIDKVPISGTLPFDQLLVQGINALAQKGANDPRRRLMVVFSNGIPPTTDVNKLQTLPDLARQNDVAVFVVYFGASEQPATAANLRRTATLANWRYYWYTSTGAMESVFQQIYNFGFQYVLTYRSKAAASGNHTLRAAVRAGEESKIEVYNSGQYSVTLAPPRIQVTVPEGGLVRHGNEWNSVVTDTVPAAVPVAFTMDWPDSHKRQITRLSYAVDDGVEQIVENPPATGGTVSVDVDVKGLGDGPHTLDAYLTDELGLRGQVEDVVIPIRIVLPEPPLIERLRQTLARVGPPGALIISLLLLIAAIYIYRKRPAVVMSTLGTLGRSVKVATDFFVRPKAGERKPAKAYLMPLNGADANQEPIAIRAETTRLGRDDSWANIVLQDTSVSRLHAKIVEEQDGGFKVYDEGSKSGTYVNEEEVGIKGTWLRDGDVVALGRDEFQFKLEIGPKEATEIYERVSRNRPAKETTEVPTPAKEKTDVQTRTEVKDKTDIQTKTAKDETNIPDQPSRRLRSVFDKDGDGKKS